MQLSEEEEFEDKERRASKRRRRRQKKKKKQKRRQKHSHHFCTTGTTGNGACLARTKWKWSYRIALSLSCCGALGGGRVRLWERRRDQSELLRRGERVRRRARVGAHVRDANQTRDASDVCGWTGRIRRYRGDAAKRVLSLSRPPEAPMWLVGPMFASFTGLAFKEGACYGKPEAFALFLLSRLSCALDI